MRQNPHVRICGGPGSATTLVYPTVSRHDHRLHAFAAVHGGSGKHQIFRLSAVLDELEAFAGGAECLLGGNLMAIDLLHLQVVRFSNPMNDGIHVPRVSELDNQSDTLLDDSPDRTYRPSLLRE